MYYVVTFLSITLCAYIHNADMSLHMTKSLALNTYTLSTIYLSDADLLLIMVILPVAVTLTISVVQMLAGFIVTPIVSFACVCGLHVISAYYTVWYLWGSYTMWIRSSYVNELGVEPGGGLISTAVVFLTAVIMGHIYFRNRDIL